MPHIQVWIYSTGIYGLTWPDLVFVEMRLNKFPELLKLQWPLAHKLRWKVCVCWGGGVREVQTKSPQWEKEHVRQTSCLNAAVQGYKEALFAFALFCSSVHAKHHPKSETLTCGEKMRELSMVPKAASTKDSSRLPFFSQWESADLTNNHVASNLGCILCDP